MMTTQEMQILEQFKSAAKQHSQAWNIANAHDIALAMEQGKLDCSPELADEILKVFWAQIDHVESWWIGDSPQIRQMRRILGISAS